MGGHHHHHVEYHYVPSPAQINELEKQKKMAEENKKKIEQMEEEQRKKKEEEEKKAKEKELEEIKRKNEELKRQKKLEEEKILNLQKSAYDNFTEKCNSNSIEKINNIIKLFSTDFNKKYLSKELFESCLDYIKSIYNLSSKEFKLEENVEKILDKFLKEEISKIKKNEVKLNILVIGPSGVGKSTLINEFLELDENHKAKTSDCEACTMNNELYESEKNPQFSLIDTRGIEKDLKNFGIEKMIESIKNEISSRNKSNDPKQFVHGIWYCINSSRFEDSEIKCLKELSNIYKNSGMPILIVFTQSINKYMAEEIEKKINSLENNYQFIRVLAKEKYIDDGILIPSKGLDDLMEISLKIFSKSQLPAYCKTIEENIKYNIQKFISKFKKIINQPKDLIKKSDLLNLIKNEINNLFKEYNSISNSAFSTEIENEINLFIDKISEIINQKYQCFEDNNKNELFNELKELNAEMRNENENLTKGITREVSDTFYNNNSNKLKLEKEKYEAEFILNYFSNEFISIFDKNVEKEFNNIFDSIYYNKIELNLKQII